MILKKGMKEKAGLNIIVMHSGTQNELRHTGIFPTQNMNLVNSTNSGNLISLKHELNLNLSYISYGCR